MSSSLEKLIPKQGNQGGDKPRSPDLVMAKSQASTSDSHSAAGTRRELPTFQLNDQFLDPRDAISGKSGSSSEKSSSSIGSIFEGGTPAHSGDESTRNAKERKQIRSQLVVGNMYADAAAALLHQDLAEQRRKGMSSEQLLTKWQLDREAKLKKVEEARRAESPSSQG